jgi:predicted thioesterase
MNCGVVRSNAIPSGVVGLGVDVAVSFIFGVLLGLGVRLGVTVNLASTPSAQSCGKSIAGVGDEVGLEVSEGLENVGEVVGERVSVSAGVAEAEGVRLTVEVVVEQAAQKRRMNRKTA